MRFCPFCSAENVDEATHCVACARRLPPLPPRRRRDALTPVPERSDTVADDRGQTLAGRDPAPRDGLAQVALGPAAQRRPPPNPAVRQPGEQARRQGDVVGGNGPPAPGRERTVTLPAPDRAERDRRASSSEVVAELPPPPHRPAPEVGAAERLGSPQPESRPVTPIASRSATPPPPAARAVSPPPPPAPVAEADDAGREPSGQLPEPPPTRVSPVDADATFQPPDVAPIPEVPEPGFYNSVRYALHFARARWQRRSAIRVLEEEIRDNTAQLDAVLRALGKQAREVKLENRVLAAENEAIDAAEERWGRIERECDELSNRQAEENSRFADLESERESKVADAEGALDRAQNELSALETQRRTLRDKRKAIEKQQKGSLKAAEDRDEQAGKAAIGEQRAALRRAAEDLRREAAGLDPERQDLERRLAAMEKPIAQATAHAEALKAELESARRSLNDAREGHRHRLAEIEAEQGRKSRELAQAEAEIQRRLVTLGTLVNLHRIARPEFGELYARIDVLRNAIGARSTEIDRFTAEREAYDRGSLVRGFVVLGAAVVVAITLLVILLAVL